MAKILLAEDDENLGFMIQDSLSDVGHEVVWKSDGQSALEVFTKADFEICLLDVMMPKMDGFELALKIRALSEFVPILFLTAKSQEADRLEGFEVGGDDYITKPFSIKELAFRIQVFLRRSGSPSSPVKSSEIVSFGQSSYDPVNLTYSYQGTNQSLTQMEANLLNLLLQHRNELVKREFILETIWGENDYFKGRSLDVFITRLRKYLKNDESLEIRNHHGVGFNLLIAETG